MNIQIISEMEFEYSKILKTECLEKYDFALANESN